MDIRETVSLLSQAEKLDLLDFLKHQLEEDEFDGTPEIPSECVHCGHAHLVRNGSIRGKQRFKCKGCIRTFSHDAFKLRFNSRTKPKVWRKYVELMLDGFSLRNIRDRMKALDMPISLPTAFTWRHKVLAVLRKATKTNLSGIVEADETFFRVSFKGSREDLGREPYKRGMPASKRGISNEQVCVSTGVDRNGTEYLKPVCLGRMKISDFQGNLARHIDWNNSTFLTDGHNAYVPPADNGNTSHVRIKGHGSGAWHINTVNSCHSHLKTFLKPFKGVATKYLDHYLAFFQWRKLGVATSIKETRAWIGWQDLPRMKFDLSW